MHVGNAALLAVANFILQSTASIFYDMYDMMLHKQIENPENTGFVHCHQHCLQFGKRYRMEGGQHGTRDKNTV